MTDGGVLSSELLSELLSELKQDLRTKRMNNPAIIVLIGVDFFELRFAFDDGATIFEPFLLCKLAEAILEPQKGQYSESFGIR